MSNVSNAPIVLEAVVGSSSLKDNPLLTLHTNTKFEFPQNQSAGRRFVGGEATLSLIFTPEIAKRFAPGTKIQITIAEVPDVTA